MMDRRVETLRQAWELYRVYTIKPVANGIPEPDVLLTRIGFLAGASAAVHEIGHRLRGGDIAAVRQMITAWAVEAADTAEALASTMDETLQKARAP